MTDQLSKGSQVVVSESFIIVRSDSYLSEVKECPAKASHCVFRRMYKFDLGHRLISVTKLLRYSCIEITLCLALGGLFHIFLYLVLIMTDMTEFTELQAFKTQKDGYKVTIKISSCVCVVLSWDELKVRQNLIVSDYEIYMMCLLVATVYWHKSLQFVKKKTLA